jgi:superfamily II DNA or RNA helicase
VRVNFNFVSTPETVTLTVRPDQSGLLGRIFRKASPRDLESLPPQERDLLLAIGDLRALADEMPGSLRISRGEIAMSHRLAASLDGQAAQTLDLPPLVDLTLKTDVEGMIGSPNFRLRYEWQHHGKRQPVERQGSILNPRGKARRLPVWLMDAIEVADGFENGRNDVGHWEALAKFRQALDPGVMVTDANAAARVSMTDFLAGLEVRLADRFAIAPTEAGDDFEVLPFSGQSMREAGFAEGDEGVPETAGELSGEALRTFQKRVRERGALPAFQLAPGSFLVIDRAVRTVLETMARVQKEPAADRTAFVRNPRARITQAVEEDLRKAGRLDGLSPEAEEEAIEAAAGPAFVETREFSERVVGIKIFEKAMQAIEAGSTTWLPENFAQKLAGHLAEMSDPDLAALRERVASAMEAGQPSVLVDEVTLPARQEALNLIDQASSARAARQSPDEQEEEVSETGKSGPFVLDTLENIDELRWQAKLQPRRAAIGDELPATIQTPLKDHQVDSFDWQVNAWKAGLPGVLNADEQGLGKTLQTVAFLAWLKDHMAKASDGARGPVLVVAPTSLLLNWEQEVERHLRKPGLGHLVRLYGGSTQARKQSGASGRDTDSGEAKLDLEFLKEAVAEGRAHRFWVLTTYTTLSNYQHSLQRVRFSAVVFDEIQTLKNYHSLRAVAGRSVNADFRIGLTGTPIENSVMDLWSIMEPLGGGLLDTEEAFRERYKAADKETMADLHARVFKPVGALPPLGLRRLKQDVARDLQPKQRRIHPRLMPSTQEAHYEDAKLKLAGGGLGAVLKALHHIRSVSVHPALQAASDDAGFINASARLQATFDILRDIRRRQERALVFIEHRQMQYRFIELARSEFKLGRIELINGDTPIPQRQAIVNRFQRHLDADGGFDLLVLGPKAAGTGLTLTAATHVIHLSRWWNPAVEEQCNDRTHRIGQKQRVTIHVPMAIHGGYREHSFDCLLQSLMQRKRNLAQAALWPMGDTLDDTGELQRTLLSGENKTGGDALRSAISAMFERDRFSPPVFDPDGSVEIK